MLYGSYFFPSQTSCSFEPKLYITSQSTRCIDRTLHSNMIHKSATQIYHPLARLALQAGAASKLIRTSLLPRRHHFFATSKEHRACCDSSSARPPFRYFGNKTAINRPLDRHHGQVRAYRAYLPVSGPSSDLPAAGVPVRQAGKRSDDIGSVRYTAKYTHTHSSENTNPYPIIATKTS